MKRSLWILTQYAVPLAFLFVGRSPVCGQELDPILYVVDEDSRLGTINLTTGAANVVGGLGVNLFDIAFRADGKLFGVDPEGLYEVNPVTASTSLIGGQGFDGTIMNALVFSSDGTLYAAGRDSTLYTVEPETGTATSVGTIGFNSAGDLAFDASGQLYLSSTRNTLVKVDTTSGAGTEIGEFGFAEVLGLARDQNNVVYGYSFSDIFTVDLETGTGTQLLSYLGSGLSQAFGGSFREEAINLPPEVESAMLTVNLGEQVNFSFIGSDPDMKPADLAWSLATFLGPDSHLAPVFDATTQEFRWDTIGSEIGDYVATVDAFDGDLTGSGVLTIHLVPEPSTTVLSVLGAICLVAMVRKNSPSKTSC